MEILLRKSAVYSFFMGIGIAILLVNYKEVENLGDGVRSISYKPIAEYIISVLRFGVIASFLGLLCGLYIVRKNR
ncbi:hypothetical protein AB1K83_15080 [Sporosarcina sp. 179-K 3D1 HS]|uniref:hypothetical protein n=1 Tax=Sporosarcina sp. 179-K 3D1 HS TaxID=3232169 RepID=UPI0039A12D70